uniref:glucan endo-1,3-beta-D-glucosidase n=1 Tax=Kalanchoe fedtschenkoi TaxID=63787 RepID=A0A7N1A5H8_KALFE
MASGLQVMLLLLFPILALSDVGVNWGRIANDLPEPPQVVRLLKSQGINRVKIFDTNPSVLTALAHSNISIVVAMPNELLSQAAAAQSFTDAWVRSNISPHVPATNIISIAVGNEVFVDPNNTTEFLVPAMKNLYASLTQFKLSHIKISSPIALSCLATSYPTSSGSFKPDLVETAIKPMLDFLRTTASPLMLNVYPFFAYTANSDTISLDYALLRDNKGVLDQGSGLTYTSLFDAQIDAVFAAMKALQYDDVKISVTETGWPSIGDENEIGAGHENAAAYNGNLVRRVLTGTGTPMNPNQPLDVYLFALFNENQKSGPTSERNYGLFYPNQQKVYDISLKGTDSAPPAAAGQTWCVASDQASEDKLREAMNYACGEGGADCRPIQEEGSTCHNPDSLIAQASYAFNSYYQKKARATGTCDFGGAAYVITQQPRFGNCDFPSGY